MKKILALSIVCVMLLAIAVLPSFASVESDMQSLLGAAVSNPQFTVKVDAPETYKPGSSISVTVSVNNLKHGIHVFEGEFFYDATKLTLTNGIKDEALDCVTKVPSSKWESMCHKASDGKVGLSVFAINESDGAASNNGDITFKLNFDVKANASGDLGFCVSNKNLIANAFDGNDFPEYKGNGSYDICAQFVQSESSTPDNSAPDNSTSDNSTPDNSTPDNSKPDNSTPDASTPDDSSADESVDESDVSVDESKTDDSDDTEAVEGSDDESKSDSKVESKNDSDKADASGDDGEKSNKTVLLIIAIIAVIAAGGVAVLLIAKKNR